MFDKTKPHGHCQGEGAGGAQYYQDGHYYDVEGRYLFSNPGIAPPPGQKLRTMEQAETAYQLRRDATARAEASRPAAPETPVAQSAPTPAAPETGALTREQQLNQFGVPKLQQLQLVALQAMHPDKELAVLKKELIGGPGAKQKLVKWLLDNTTA